MVSWNEVKCMECKPLMLYSGCMFCKYCVHEGCKCNKDTKRKPVEDLVGGY
jgi:hypothetical protein